MLKGDVQFVSNVLKALRDFSDLSVDGKMAIVEDSLSFSEADEKINKALDKHIELLKTDEFLSLEEQVESIRKKGVETWSDDDRDQMTKYDELLGKINATIHRSQQRCLMRKCK